jgi:S-adenosyl methyltransferase
LRKLTYFIAASIDGFIGAPSGDAAFFTRFVDEEFFEYLKAEYPETLPTQGRQALGIDDLENKRFDTVIQGRASYDRDRRGGPRLPGVSHPCSPVPGRRGGHRQFLDIGTGLPTANNTHEVAQAVVPECRVVYVDNDLIVLAHARALLTSSGEGATAYLDADLRDPDKIVEAAAKTLAFDQPVALMLMGILGHVGDDDEAPSIVRRLA